MQKQRQKELLSDCNEIKVDEVDNYPRKWRNLCIQEGKAVPDKSSTRDDTQFDFNPYPTAFPYGNGMVLHFYQQQESTTTKTVHKVINKGLKTYV